LQSALQISGSTTGPEASDTFSNLLSGALAGAYDGESSNKETYDLYAALLEQSSDSTGALMNALLSAGGGNASTAMILSLYGALAGNPAQGAYGNFAADAAGNVTASPWKPTAPAITSDYSNRSASRYDAVIDQFGVETNPRYSTSQGGTYCNIFVWDVTGAMGAEIPHYYNAGTGEPMKYGDEGASQMTANSMYTWLHQHGEEYGWVEVSAEEAQNLANEGHPVVTALYRSGSHGHVQVVCPSKDGTYNEEKGVTVAQAGRNLRDYTYISSILGDSSLSRVSYFAHA